MEGVGVIRLARQHGIGEADGFRVVAYREVEVQQVALGFRETGAEFQNALIEPDRLAEMPVVGFGDELARLSVREQAFHVVGVAA